MNAPIYRINLELPDGSTVDLTSFLSLSFGYVLNSGSSATLSLSLENEKVDSLLKATRKTWIKIYRQDTATESAALVWYGNLLRPDVSFDQNEASLSMTFVDITTLLSGRLVNADYEQFTATEATDVVWDLINTTQGKTGGDLGITRGATVTSANRTPENSLQDRTIKEVLQEYSAMEDGFDYEITPTPSAPTIGIFNTYYTSGQRYHKGEVKGTALEYTVNEGGAIGLGNVKSGSIGEEGDQFANVIRAKGSTPENVQLSTDVSDATSISAYALVEDLMQAPDVENLTDLEAIATEEVTSRSLIPVSMNFTLMPHTNPRFGTYDVGDIFPVNWNYKDRVVYSGQYRVYKIDVNVDKNGVETVNLNLNVI